MAPGKNPTAKKNKGSGSHLRSKQKFLLQLFEKTGDVTILQQLEDIKIQLASSSSNLYQNIVYHDSAERATHLVEPVDLHSYIALHPQLRQDRFGLPCYGPEFQTPGQFYVDMYQVHRIMLKADYYPSLPEETRNCREYAILNRLIMNADCRLHCLDKQFETADALLTELENLQRSGKLPNLIRKDDEHMEARELEDPVEPLLIEATVQRTVVQTYCATSELVQRQQPSMSAPIPIQLETTPKQSLPCDGFKLGNWAEETMDIELPSSPTLRAERLIPGEENTPQNGGSNNQTAQTPGRTSEMKSYRPTRVTPSSGLKPESRATKRGQRQLRAAYKCMIRSTWVESLMERYNVGGPGPP